MRTILEVEPAGRRFRLRVRREDQRGNVVATSTVEASSAALQRVARQALAIWLALDELRIKEARRASGAR